MMQGIDVWIIGAIGRIKAQFFIGGLTTCILRCRGAVIIVVITLVSCVIVNKRGWQAILIISGHNLTWAAWNHIDVYGEVSLVGRGHSCNFAWLNIIGITGAKV